MGTGNIDRAVEFFTFACHRRAIEGLSEPMNCCDVCGKPIARNLAVCEECWEAGDDDDDDDPPDDPPDPTEVDGVDYLNNWT